jgi:hypothetical protein
MGLGDSHATPLASLATPHGPATHQCALAISEDSHDILRGLHAPANPVPIRESWSKAWSHTMSGQCQCTELGGKARHARQALCQALLLAGLHSAALKSPKNTTRWPSSRAFIARSPNAALTTARIVLLCSHVKRGSGLLTLMHCMRPSTAVVLLTFASPAA